MDMYYTIGYSTVGSSKQPLDIDREDRERYVNIEKYGFFPSLQFYLNRELKISKIDKTRQVKIPAYYSVSYGYFNIAKLFFSEFGNANLADFAGIGKGKGRIRFGEVYYDADEFIEILVKRIVTEYIYNRIQDAEEAENFKASHYVELPEDLEESEFLVFEYSGTDEELYEHIINGVGASAIEDIINQI